MSLNIGQVPRPKLTPKTKLKIKPQMIAKLKLLSKSSLDMLEEIEKEKENNPALELETENRFEVPLSSLRNNDKKDAKQQFLEGAVSRGETLQEHLLVQLRAQKNVDKKAVETAELLVQNLNNDGFNSVPPQEVAKDVDEKTLQEAVQLVQRMDPPGTCTDNPIESILVQASLRQDAPDGTEEVITGCLELLDQGKYKKIAKELDITEEQVKEIQDYIDGNLNFFPGQSFPSAGLSYEELAIPEITITKVDDEIVILPNDKLFPSLKISSFAKKLAESPDTDKETRKYIQEQIDAANLLIEAIPLRKKNLEKAAKGIVEYQRDFFLNGPKHLKPLTQKEFAEKIGMSGSTISRIANEKYVQTDWGVYPFSYFFPSQGKSAQENINEIIEKYKDTKLSDQQISDLLKQEGIEMARRTVSKYRPKNRRQV